MIRKCFYIILFMIIKKTFNFIRFFFTFLCTVTYSLFVFYCLCANTILLFFLHIKINFAHIAHTHCSCMNFRCTTHIKIVVVVFLAQKLLLLLCVLVQYFVYYVHFTIFNTIAMSKYNNEIK